MKFAWTQGPWNLNDWPTEQKPDTMCLLMEADHTIVVLPKNWGHLTKKIKHESSEAFRSNPQFRGNTGLGDILNDTMGCNQQNPNCRKILQEKRFGFTTNWKKKEKRTKITRETLPYMDHVLSQFKHKL